MFTRSNFQMWGAAGGRIRARRLTKARRKQIAREAAAARKYIPVPKKADNRIAAMADRYRRGETLEKIGLDYGLTRERVRQLLKKAKGKVVKGRSLKSLIEARERIQHITEAKEKRIHSRFGCSYSDYFKIQGNATTHTNGSPACCYVHQMNTAAKRGIPWKFTFVSWWDIWEKSGKWMERGRGKDGYCMARFGDSGAYEPSNVKIITNSQNAIESFDASPAQDRYEIAAKYKIPTSDILGMTPRMLEIWKLREAGNSAGKIAEKLGLKPNTVSTQLTACRHKLGLIPLKATQARAK